MKEVHLVLTEVMIRKYKAEDFDELAKVMDEGRMQELEAEGMEQVFKMHHISSIFCPVIFTLLKKMSK